MRWPRRCASSMSAKLLSPSMLIDSIGSICTATFNIRTSPRWAACLAGRVFVAKRRGTEGAEIVHGIADAGVRPVPPGDREQALDHLVREPAPQDPAGIADHDGEGWHVLGDDRARADRRTGPDRHARKHDGAVPDPDVMAEDDRRG